MSSSRTLRVVSIAHPAVSHEAGRLRYYPLAERRDLDLHLVIPQRWHEFGRATSADPPDDPRLKVHIMPIRLPRAGPMNWYLHYYPGLKRLIRQVAPDVIHLWEEPWSVVALQAVLLKGEAALVLEVDQNIIKRLPPPFEAIRKYVLRHTDHILARSDDATAVVRARGYAGPTTLIGYGIDEQTFWPDCAPQMTRASGSVRIGYVGRIVDEKGVDDALDAIMRARSQVSLAIMGEGPHEQRLRQRIRQLGLADRVTIQGWGPPGEVARFMRNLDAIILLTRTVKSFKEQFGRVIIEAQACGIPVIGSTCGAIPDVIGRGGWVVPERAPEALAKVLDRIAGDPDELRVRSLEARKNVATRFTFAAVAEALAKACTEAAATRTNYLRSA